MKAPRVPFSTLCKILGVSERRGKEWKRTGLFDKVGTRRCGELDAIKGAIIKVLVNELDHDDAEMVWNRLRNRLGEIVFGPRVDLVCLITERDAALCRTDEEVGRAASSGGTIVVIPLAADIQRVRERFQRETASRGARRTSHIQGNRSRSVRT